MVSVVNSPDGTGDRGQHPGRRRWPARPAPPRPGPGKIDAWFVAFAPAANPTIAVAVLLPNQPSANEYQGGTIAAPIAKAMIEAVPARRQSVSGATQRPLPPRPTARRALGSRSG